MVRVLQEVGYPVADGEHGVAVFYVACLEATPEPADPGASSCRSNERVEFPGIVGQESVSPFRCSADGRQAVQVARVIVLRVKRFQRTREQTVNLSKETRPGYCR